MPIAFDAVVDGGLTNVTTTHSYAHTCAGSDRLLLVAVLIGATADDVTGVTYNGVAMTRVGTIADSLRRVYLYELVGPASGTHNVVVSTGTNQLIIAGSASYTGVASRDTQTTNQGAST